MTRMREEILSLPEVIARQLDRHLAEYRDAGRAIGAAGPTVVATCARGSSDHAATYFSYVAQSLTGVPVASMPPSLGAVLEAPLMLADVPVLAISQSGGSADLCRFMEAAGRAGARTCVLTNTPGSPLTQAADGGVRQIRTSLFWPHPCRPQAARSARHSARAAARLVLK